MADESSQPQSAQLSLTAAAPDGTVLLRNLRAGDSLELERIHRTAEVARWWGEPETGFPFQDEPDAVRLVIELDGQSIGLIQFHEEPTPRYRHASIDLFLDPVQHGRGLGTVAVGILVRYLIEERGHHRLTIDPAAENSAAIRAYEKVGFRSVGVMRQYEQASPGCWRDGLLMELLTRPADRLSADGERRD
jgi:aminoglycoside 6'-N-acetyltransferase